MRFGKIYKMMNVQVDDIKVVGANVLCLFILQVQSINTELQSILFLCTIGYTLVRTVNEIKKFISNKNGKANISPADNKEEV